MSFGSHGEVGNNQRMDSFHDLGPPDVTWVTCDFDTRFPWFLPNGVRMCRHRQLTYSDVGVSRLHLSPFCAVAAVMMMDDGGSAGASTFYVLVYQVLLMSASNLLGGESEWKEVEEDADGRR